MAKDPLQFAKEALDKALETEKRNRRLLDSIGPAVIDALRPILNQIREAVSAIKVDVKPVIEVNPEVKIPEIRVPDVYVPDIFVPEPKVTVNVPLIKVPDVVMPDEMNVRGWVQLMGVDLNNPLPVQLRDAKGNPVSLFENLTQIIGSGSGGGKHDFFTIRDIRSSTASVIDQIDNAVRVVSIGGIGLTDTELRATAVPVSQVSGASWSVEASQGGSWTLSQVSGATDSVNLTQVGGNAVVVGTGYQDNALRVVLATDAVASVSVTGTAVVSATDLDIRDLVNASDSISAYQVSGAIWSVSVNDAFRTTVASSLINSDDRLRVSLETGGSGLTDSELRATAVPVSQVSGAIWSVSVNDAFRTTVTSNLINADDRLRVSLETGGSGLTDSELRATAVPVSQVSGASWSTEATQAGTWTVALSGALTSAVVTGPVVADVADDGSAPVKIGGIARTANPTAVAAGDSVSLSADDLGRQLTRPVQVRDLTITAYATYTTGTEATLLAATAGSLHDLIYVLASNNSTAAVGIDIRPVLAGNVVMHLEIPANGVVGVATPVPIPQSASDTGNAWTVDLPDITGTTVYVSALFSREV